MNPSTITDLFTLIQRLEDRIRKLENQLTVSTRKLVISRLVKGNLVKYTFVVAASGQLQVTSTIDGAIGSSTFPAHTEVVADFALENQLNTANAVISAIPVITSLKAATITANDVTISRVVAGQVTIQSSAGDSLDDYVIGVNGSDQLITVNQTTNNVTLIGAP